MVDRNFVSASWCSELISLQRHPSFMPRVSFPRQFCTYLSVCFLLTSLLSTETSPLVSTAGGLIVSSLCSVCSTAVESFVTSSVFLRPGRSSCSRMKAEYSARQTCNGKGGGVETVDS